MWPPPKNPSEVRQFLGLANYFNRFVHDYASIAAPLLNLTKSKVAFDFGSNEAAQRSFEMLKTALCQAPVLVLPDPKLPYELVCDASGIGCGAILMQEGHPVAFFSYRLEPREQKYPIGEQELLAVKLALEKFRCYVQGADLTVVTDHRPNCFLFNKRPEDFSSRQTKWCQSLTRFEPFKWEYRKGSKNVADPLSRYPAWLNVSSWLNVLTRAGAKRQPEKSVETNDRNNEPISKDSDVETLKQRIVRGYDDDHFFSIEKNLLSLAKRDDFWWRQELICVPNSGSLRTDCIRLHHDPPYVGHLGRDKTVKLVLRQFWWPTVAKDVAAYVQSCHSCQKNKPSNQRPAGLLQPLPIPSRKWQSVSVDLITHLPCTKDGHTAIVVFVDRLSKMVHFCPAWTTTSAVDMAYIFLKEIFRLHGLPETIISDRDPRFTSAFWREVSGLLGLKRCMSTAFHPQSDGQTERANRTLEDMLRNYVSPSQDDWDRKLPLCEFAINNAWNSSTGESAFFLNYGCHPHVPSVVEGSYVSSQLPAVKDFVENMQKSVQRARECLQQAQACMKKSSDKRRRDVEYAVGDWVWLSNKNIDISTYGTRKLEGKWLGPFRIVKRVNPVAYELDLTKLMRVHDVFHVSMFKKWEGDPNGPPPPAILPSGSVEHEVESIIAHKSERNHTKYLVKWLGRDSDENSWLSDSELVNAQDTVERYYRYNAAASHAAQDRKAKKQAADEKLASDKAAQRLAIVMGTAPSEQCCPMEVETPKPLLPITHHVNCMSVAICSWWMWSPCEWVSMFCLRVHTFRERLARHYFHVASYVTSVAWGGGRCNSTREVLCRHLWCTVVDWDMYDTSQCYSSQCYVSSRVYTWHWTHSSPVPPSLRYNYCIKCWARGRPCHFM